MRRAAWLVALAACAAPSVERPAPDHPASPQARTRSLEQSFARTASVAPPTPAPEHHHHHHHGGGS